MRTGYSRQAGMVLLICLVFLLLLTLIGFSSMQAAISQERLAGSIWGRNQAFQSAEGGLRLGESVIKSPGFGLAPCHSIATCAPPVEALSITGPGTNPVSAIAWVGMKDGVYGIQNLGSSVGVAQLPADTPVTLYRVTSVATGGPSRAVLESVYARVATVGGERFQRVMWRQLQ